MGVFSSKEFSSKPQHQKEEHGSNGRSFSERTQESSNQRIPVSTQWSNGLSSIKTKTSREHPNDRTEFKNSKRFGFLKRSHTRSRKSKKIETQKVNPIRKGVKNKRDIETDPESQRQPTAAYVPQHAASDFSRLSGRWSCPEGAGPPRRPQIASSRSEGSTTNFSKPLAGWRLERGESRFFEPSRTPKILEDAVTDYSPMDMTSEYGTAWPFPSQSNLKFSEVVTNARPIPYNRLESGSSDDQTLIEEPQVAAGRSYESIDALNETKTNPRTSRVMDEITTIHHTNVRREAPAQQSRPSSRRTSVFENLGEYIKPSRTDTLAWDNRKSIRRCTYFRDSQSERSSSISTLYFSDPLDGEGKRGTRFIPVSGGMQR